MIAGLKNIFHRCKRSIHIKDIEMVHFKIAITKIFFISGLINCYKIRLCFNNNSNNNNDNNNNNNNNNSNNNNNNH